MHVEAGLRSFDREMPEEINRVLTDQIADRLYTTERSAADNLAARGHRPRRACCFVGNVMIDSLLRTAARAAAPPADTLQRATASTRRVASAPEGFGVVTLHRPSNVDECRRAARGARRCSREVAARLPLVWPVHPRARANIERFGLAASLAERADRACCRRRATSRCSA